MTNKHYCKLCDGAINRKPESKQNKTRTQKQKERNIIYKYHMEKAGSANVVEMIDKYINDFLDDFEDGNITGNFSRFFNNGLVKYNTNIMALGQYLLLQRCANLIIFEELLSSIDKHIEKGYISLNVSHLTIRITTRRNSMTKSFYLKQKKSRLEWTFLKKNIELYL